MDRNLQALYLLSLARNFQPKHYDLIVSQLGTIDAILDADENELALADLPKGMYVRMLEARRTSRLEDEIAALADQGIKLVGWGNEGYPELLAAIPDAPLLLYCKGKPELMRGQGIAIVGSRKCSERGREMAGEFGAALAELGVPMVSGMALGIDGAAHEGALSVNGPTVAVLGCGVDVVYPPRHHELYERLCAEALVVSEYPPLSEPRKEHFPQRNRIISGLSRGTLVVEAPLGSGALITARVSIEQGRDVFAVPGPVKSPYTKGTHSLIKSGQAKLTENVDDILIEYGTNRAALRNQRAEQVKLQLEDDTGSQLAPSAASSRTALSPDEQRLIEQISYEGSHINDLVRKLGITTSQCISHLTMLEIKGLISSASGGYYIRL